MLRRLMTALVAITLALVLMPGMTLAKDDGKSVCKNGGWRELVRPDGSAFINQGMCVSFVAKGGTPVPANPIRAVRSQWWNVLRRPPASGRRTDLPFDGRPVPRGGGPSSCLVIRSAWGCGGGRRFRGATGPSGPPAGLSPCARWYLWTNQGSANPLTGASRSAHGVLGGAA
jgi:hypothetical protein